MAKVCLRVNFLLDGQMHKRGEVLDEDKIPKHMRTERYINKVDLSGRDGQVMLLHGLGYHREQMVDGTIMACPVFCNPRGVDSVVGHTSSTEGRLEGGS